jgi:hypothetical protein
VSELDREKEKKEREGERESKSRERETRRVVGKEKGQRVGGR